MDKTTAVDSRSLFVLERIARLSADVRDLQRGPDYFELDRFLDSREEQRALIRGLLAKVAAVSVARKRDINRTGGWRAYCSIFPWWAYATAVRLCCCSLYVLPAYVWVQTVQRKEMAFVLHYLNAAPCEA